MKPGFSFLYCGVYCVSVRLEDVTLGFAGYNVEMNVRNSLSCTRTVLWWMDCKSEEEDRANKRQRTWHATVRLSPL